MNAIQLDFFKSSQECEMDALRFEMAAVKKSCDKVRRGLYAENGALKKRILELESRMEAIERGLAYYGCN